MRPFRRIKNFLHALRGGSTMIAFGSEGEEVIHEDERAALEPEERDKWEATDESTILYRRKR